MLIAVLLTVILSYLVITLFGHLVHWSLHQKWAGRFNKAHMTHHLKMYPVEDFSSDTYRDAGKDSTPKFFIFMALPLIMSPIILMILGIIPLYLMITILLMQAIVGFPHDIFHDAFHINNHWMTRFSFFNNLVKLHYFHHLDMSKNFGIYSFHWDKLLGSFKNK